MYLNISELLSLTLDHYRIILVLNYLKWTVIDTNSMRFIGLS